MQLIKRKQIKRLNLLLRQALKTASPCAWLENLLFKNKLKQLINLAQHKMLLPHEQMVNTGAVSRGQFGQVVAPQLQKLLRLHLTMLIFLNLLLSRKHVRMLKKTIKYNSSVKQQKRKHKEQREQHQHHHNQEPQQQQVHEEVVQLSRQEQRELKRQQKRQQQDQPHATSK